jgi:hypothetical protein
VERRVAIAGDLDQFVVFDVSCHTNGKHLYPGFTSDASWFRHIILRATISYNDGNLDNIALANSGTAWLAESLLHHVLDCQTCVRQARQVLHFANAPHNTILVGERAQIKLMPYLFAILNEANPCLIGGYVKQFNKFLDETKYFVAKDGCADWATAVDKEHEIRRLFWACRLNDTDSSSRETCITAYIGVAGNANALIPAERVDAVSRVIARV